MSDDCLLFIYCFDGTSIHAAWRMLCSAGFNIPFEVPACWALLAASNASSSVGIGCSQEDAQVGSGAFYPPYPERC